MSANLDARRSETTRRLMTMRGKLGEAEGIAKDRACVYVTGSFGRGEATLHSDLDLFIAGRTVDPVPGQSERRAALSRLNEICIKAELIEATRAMGIQEFSGDGQYLDHYTVEQLVKTLGHPDDDARNTFTARLLLLLESKPLFGDNVYWEAIDQVIAAYWSDFEGHSRDFVPAFLANDILRVCRSFNMLFGGLRAQPLLRADRAVWRRQARLRPGQRRVRPRATRRRAAGGERPSRRPIQDS